MSRALLKSWHGTLVRCGDAVALVDAASGKTWTFRELDDQAAAWAAQHAPVAGALKGRPVVFGVPNGLAWLQIFLGLIRAGAVAVPLDSAEPLPAQRELAVALRAAAWWDGQNLASLSGSRRFRDPEICLIKLTSGSTGQPRPLVFTAGQMLADSRQVTATMRIGPEDTNYALIPLGHSYALGNLVLPLLAHGVPMVCGATPLPQAIAADIARWRPTVFPSVPTVLRALVVSDIAAEKLKSLRLIISAGSPLPPEVARDFAARFGQRVHSFFGSSETGGITFDTSGAATLRGSVGRAMRGVRVTLERGKSLRVTSPAVFTYGNRDCTRGVGNWRPPDRVQVDAHGEIVLLGRRSSIVKVNGRRVSLNEVAARIRGLRGVQDVWIGTSQGSESVLGVAVASQRTVAELRAELQTGIAPWKIPKKWIVLPDLPLTARGKVDPRSLRRQLFG